MSSGPPKALDTSSSEGTHDRETRILNIDELHLHVNDLDALRRLNDSDPELARIVVDQQDKSDTREHASFRFAVALTSFLVLGILLAGSYVFVNLGVLPSIFLIMFFFLTAAIIRVVLTGEWPDTSWIGKAVLRIISIFGGRPKEENGDD